MAADEKALGNLHTKLCEVLGDLLDGQTIPAELDEEGNELSPPMKLPPSAAILTVVAKVLKDNNITCTPSKDNAIGALEDKMRERDEKRKARQASQADLKTATSDMSFMEGLPN